MKLKRLLRLPLRIKNVVLSMRHDVRESRELISELTRSVLACRQMILDTQQLVAERQQTTAGLVEQRFEALNREIPLLGERLVGEIREQGLLAENAARSLARADAERKLRERLTIALERRAGVSILIPCWNHAGFLRRTIGSALATLQVLPVPGEVVILDDGSRDGSREIARELVRCDKRIRSIESDDNLGLPRARNVLLSQARFDHAMILDSDNELVPSGVAVLYEMAVQTDAALSYGNIVRLDERQSVLDVVSGERVTADLLQENWIDAMALVRTARVLELGGYDCHWLHGFEDWELNQRLFVLGQRMVFVPVLIGKYWRHPLSMGQEAPAASRNRRSQRIFGSAIAMGSAQHQVSVRHPATGTIWSSTERKALTMPVGGNTGKARSGLKILVVGSGGVRNYGDDAILLSTLERLRRIRPDSVAAVVTDGPHVPPLGRLGAWRGTCDELISSLDAGEILSGCGGATAVGEELMARFGAGTRPGADLRAFDVVVMAGGGNLNSYWPDIVARRAAIAAAANAAGVPYILTGQGVGPVSPEIVPLLSFLVSGACDVATRDSVSLSLLKRIVRNGPQMMVVGDDALGLWCDDPLVARSRLAEIGVPVDRPLLGFQAREALYVGMARDQLEETARGVDEFATENGYVVIAVPINMQTQAPEAELLTELAFGRRRRARWHVVNDGGNVAAIAGTIKSCRAVLTHSYHHAIFALESRIPTLLYAGTEYYEMKAEALRTGFGIPVSLVARPGMGKDEIGYALKNVAESCWTGGMTSADVDRWLDRALPERDGAVDMPSNRWSRYTVHAGSPSPPAPKALGVKSVEMYDSVIDP